VKQMFRKMTEVARSTANRGPALALLGSLGAVLAWSASADAAFGRRGNFMIGVERVFGVYSDHSTQEFDTGDQSSTATNLGLFYQEQGSALSVPRVTFDYFLIDHLSIGTGFGFYAYQPDTNIESISGFILAPRVGYAFAFTDRFGVQPHAGLTYFSRTVNYVNAIAAPDDSDRNLLALAVDGTVYFMAAPNVGFTGTVALDLGLTGSQSDPLGARDGYREQLIGLTFGMFGHF
jgi:hypothetical protein